MTDIDWFRGLDPRPWTKSSLRSLKHEIMSGGSATTNLSYQDVSIWYNQALALVVGRLRQARLNVENRPVDMSFRVKTIGTLREKLLRQPTYPINQIRDVIGVRIVSDMNLRQQDILAVQIQELFDCVELIDLRNNSHSGYRALHLAVKLPENVQVEIQIRTSLQDDWANCYELAADVYGRNIRYGKYPEAEEGQSMVLALQHLSTHDITELEATKQDASVTLEERLRYSYTHLEHADAASDLSYLELITTFYLRHYGLSRQTTEGEFMVQRNLQQFRAILEKHSR